MYEKADQHLFEFEDHLTRDGYRKLWLGALSLAKNYSPAPYGNNTHEHIINATTDHFGLELPSFDNLLMTEIFEEAESLAQYETWQFQYDVEHRSLL